MIRLFLAIFILLHVVCGQAFAQNAGEEVIMMDDDQADTSHENKNTIKLDFKERWKYGSVMYKEKVFGWVNTALQAHDKNTSLEILLPSIFPADHSSGTSVEDQIPVKETTVQAPGKEQAIVPEKPEEIPSFYLKSILYFGPQDWTVWINDKKIKQDESPPFLNIIKIDETQATFLWKDSKIDLRFPEWRDYMIPFDEEKKFFSNGQNVVISSETGDISFILKTNQSFIPNELKIIEGSINSGAKVSPVIPAINSTATPGTPAAPANPIPNTKSLLAGETIPGATEHMDQYINQLNSLKAIMDSSK